MNELVSIIVPVYNTEKYLRECIESLIHIDYDNLQIILVDDGSTDSSSIICDEYSNRYEYIEVHHIENHGVSYARNYGMDCANGVFILFVDSDDFVAPCYVERLLPKHKGEFVYGGRTYIKSDKIEQADMLEVQYSFSENHDDVVEAWNQSMWIFVTGACYDKHIITDRNLRFNEKSSLGEDTEFNMAYIENVDWIRIVQNTGYFHRGVDNSLGRRFHKNRLEKEKNECIMLENLAKRDLMAMRWKYWHIPIEHFELWLGKTIDKQKKKEIKKLLKRTYKDDYFKKCIGYIRSNGNLDEKIESYLMGYYRHWMYEPVLKVISLIYKFKQ